jgi:alpha-tubulin suppressor-like RCC1 family protein
MGVYRAVLWIILVGSATFAACRSGTEPEAFATLSIRDTTLLVDERLIVPVTARDANGRPITNPSVTFASSAPSVVSISGPGTVTALAPGTAVLVAVADGIVALATITVAPQFTHLAAGGLHACGITGRGDLYCWGTSMRGELGPASDLQDCSMRFGPGILCSPIPIRSSGLRPVDIVAGDMHSCALGADGTAYCWGANFYGQAGTGSLSDVPLPSAVAGGHTFTQLVAGRMHTCGITTSRAAYCWGWDWTGALGAGDVSAERCLFFSNDPCSRTPRLVVGGHQWAQLAATDRATCGVTTLGDLYCWGLDVGGDDGQYCQAPDNLTGCTRTPILISSAKPYKATSIGNVHRCQQAVDGTLECWGANYWGMFGNGTVASSPTPVTAAGGSAYTSFVAFRTGTCALSDGLAKCWGRGEDGAVGNGDLQDALSPADVLGGHRFLALAASGVSDFVCGMTDTGRAYCWGLGVFGQLGNNAFLSASEPVLVRLVPTSSAESAKRAESRGVAQSALDGRDGAR